METIKYKDDAGNEITQVQALQLEKYTAHYYLDNEPVRFEKFNPNPNLKGGGFYIKEEELQNFITEHVTPIGSWDFYYNKRTNVFGDFVWDLISYRNNELKYRSKECYNSEGIALGYVVYDVETQEPIRGVKFYYNDAFDLNESVTSAIEFRYYINSPENPIGITINTWGLGGDPDDTYDVEEYKNIPEVMAELPWDDNPYYHNLLPILPEDPIV